MQMKILHTADWHLGLMTEGFNRRDEQQSILDEICTIAEDKAVDIVLICGDLLCGANTPAYADEMFANTMLKLSGNGRRAVVVIAGNNDATERFVTTKQFALANNVFLLNNLGTDFDENILPKDATVKLLDRGRGFLTFEKNSEKVCIAYLPYPSNFFESEKTKEGESFLDKTKRLWALGTGAFKSEYFNIAAAHLFVPHGKNTKDFYFEFDKDVLPKNANYIALGHVHDMVEVKDNVFYSGSVIQVYDKESATKNLIILNVENNKLINKEFVHLKTPKKIVVVTGETSAELKEKLSKLENCLAKVEIAQEKIKTEEILKLKEEFPFIFSFVLIPKSKKAQLNIAGKKISDEKLLGKFYEMAYAKKPSKDIEALFLQALKKESQDETN